jgi:Protein of unknown function (DUF3618)
MGQDPGTSGTAVTGTKDPDQLQAEIEETRRELGDTVEALAQKTDVKAHARRRIEQTKAAAVEKRDRIVGKAKEASPDQAASIASQIPQKAREHPLPLVLLGGIALGFLAGRRAAH